MKPWNKTMREGRKGPGLGPGGRGMQRVPIIGQKPPSNPELLAVVLGAKAAGRTVLIESVGSKVTAAGLELPSNIHGDFAWQVISAGPSCKESCGFELSPGDYVLPSNFEAMPVGDRTFALCDVAHIRMLLPRAEMEALIRKGPALITLTSVAGVGPDAG